jgi:anti-anti-sigma factor
MTETVTVVVHHNADHAVAAVRGRVFHDTIAPLARVLEPLLGADRPRVVLDLSGVDICDSSGLNLLVASHHAAARRNGWLRLAGLRPMVRRVVEITNLTRVLAIYDTVDEAIDGAVHGGRADTRAT